MDVLWAALGVAGIAVAYVGAVIGWLVLKDFRARRRDVKLALKIMERDGDR